VNRVHDQVLVALVGFAFDVRERNLLGRESASGGELLVLTPVLDDEIDGVLLSAAPQARGSGGTHVLAQVAVRRYVHHLLAVAALRPLHVEANVGGLAGALALYLNLAHRDALQAMSIDQRPL
jgi:hypothetical protein